MPRRLSFPKESTSPPIKREQDGGLVRNLRRWKPQVAGWAWAGMANRSDASCKGRWLFATASAVDIDRRGTHFGLAQAAGPWRHDTKAGIANGFLQSLG